ncbi:hypothetical protein GGR58DRAFT_524571 [Xylaria digitata]|nr:hypothetical protein GGR58DRAFT_524571 [Xylaria digitata]
MWQPFYLRIWVLATFGILFAFLVVTIEALFIVSNRSKGLATDRVVFQIQMLAPWNRMKRTSTGASEGPLLDYLDMLPPAAIIRALRLHDWAPAAVLSISLLLQNAIESSVPLELKNLFHDATSDMVLDVDLALLAMAAMSELQFPYPEGMTAQFAFQTLKDPPLPGTEIRLEVDGFAANLDCEDAKLTVLGISHRPEIWLDISITFEIERDECSIMLSTQITTPDPWKFTSLNFVRLLHGPCNNSCIAGSNRSSIVVGRLVYSIDNPYERNVSNIRVSGMEITNSAQAICVPRYDIKTVSLGQNGTSVQDVRVTQELSSKTVGNEVDLKDGSAINFDAYTFLTRSSELRQVPYSALTDAKLWLDAIPRYFQKFNTQLSQISLLEPFLTVVTGNQIETKNRLIVVGTTCHTIAALTGCCALLSIVVIITLPHDCSMNTNPTSIIGTAWTATEAPSLLLRLRDQGLGKAHAIQHQLGTAAYVLGQPRLDVFKLLPDYGCPNIQPISANRPMNPRRSGKYALALHPVTRGLFLVSLSTSIAVLETLLRLSQKHNGIGPSDLSKYPQYSWTAAPSALFTAMSLVAHSIDGATRSLAPFLALKRGGSLASTINFELLDGSIPQTFIRGLKAKSWPAISGIAAFSVSSIFTLFSGSLHMSNYAPITLGVTLGTNSAFGPNGKTTSNHTSGSNGVAMVAKLRAIRSRLQCKLYSGEQIQTNLTMNYIATGYGPWGQYRVPNPLRMDIDDENCKVNKSIEYLATTIMIPTLKEGVEEDEVIFGVSSGAEYGNFNDGQGWVGGCGTILYVWGRVAVDTNGKSTVEATALGCNDTAEILDAEVHFSTTALNIDYSHPPVPDENSARPVDFELRYDRQDGCYYEIVGPSVTVSAHIFDTFLALLTSSPWAISASDLANTSAVDKVIAAIRAQHGLIRANFLDHNWRAVVNHTSPDVSVNVLSYSANATILLGLPRVMQNLQSTRVLQALLALTLVLPLTAWCLMPFTDVIVGSSTSIARKLALAAGGNLFEDVLQCGEENCIFIIGWRSPNGSTGKKERFGIWALTAEEAQEMRVNQARRRI